MERTGFNLLLSEGLPKLTENEHSWDARLAAVLWGVIWLAIAGGLAWLAALHLKDVVSLATSGIETTAVVTDYDPRECGGRKRRHICNDHTIVASEFGSKVIDLGYPVAVGSRIVVTYDPGNKANVRVGRKPTFETLEFLDWVSLVALVFGVLKSAGSVVQIAAATLGLERFRRPKTDARGSRSEAVRKRDRAANAAPGPNRSAKPDATRLAEQADYRTEQAEHHGLAVQSLDEDTYANSLPLFQASIASFESDSIELTEIVKHIVHYLAQNGMNRAAIDQMRPYVWRFVEETYPDKFKRTSAR